MLWTLPSSTILNLWELHLQQVHRKVSNPLMFYVFKLGPYEGHTEQLCCHHNSVSFSRTSMMDSLCMLLHQGGFYLLFVLFIILGYDCVCALHANGFAKSVCRASWRILACSYMVSLNALKKHCTSLHSE